MDNIELDISEIELFNEEKICFDKDVNFIYGKNGTGKSTITKLLKEQYDSEYDIRIFQGFENLMGENIDLNAITLGEENKEINNEIEKFKKEIINKNNEIDILEKELIKSDKENLFSKRENAKKSYTNKQKTLGEILTIVAKNSRSYNDINLYNTAKYDKKNLINDMSTDEFEKISKESFDINKEKDNLIDIIKSSYKEAKFIDIIRINLKEKLEEVNRILKYIVKKFDIEILNYNDNIKFVEQGLYIHKTYGYKECLFCGNKITNDRFNKLNSYFSQDDFNKFTNKIKTEIEILENYKWNLDNIKIDKNTFYNKYLNEVLLLYNEIEELKKQHIEVIDIFINKLKEKQRNLFNELETFNLEYIPNDFNKYILEFNNLVNQNNLEYLAQNKNEVKKRLRYILIKENLIKEKYFEAKKEEEDYKNKFDEITKEFHDKLRLKESLEKEILKIEEEIKNLEDKTKNLSKAVNNINEKLEVNTSFNLICEKKSDLKYLYKVKCLRTNKIKNVTELSTGEKNIIAFLYFIEELSDINKNKDLKKIIIFDDPMNSNDDTKQYLIIDEMIKLIKHNKNNKIIILTHNSHFYINVTNNIKNNKENKKIYKFIRLISDGKYSYVKYINKEDDFKTTYDLLWKELKFLYDNDQISVDIMYNPIRRIIETYTKFNCIKQDVFYRDKNYFKKECNVNSHSIDDFQHDLSARTKEDVINDLKFCFQNNKAGDHFEKHFS